ncbi:hypothetical protein UPYG_G00303040 [Umbra pygmaea]|uniref:Uncharacterized protein n=1 Tax=Umbra pygmaea TaxID=75934 RepID=A0ABD0WBD8_UMBPY
MKRISASGGDRKIHAFFASTRTRDPQAATSTTENVLERDVRETEGASGESRAGAEREDGASECSGDELSETEKEKESDSGRREQIKLNEAAGTHGKQLCPPDISMSRGEAPTQPQLNFPKTLQGDPKQELQG